MERTLVEEKTFNHNAKWLHQLETTYCSHVTPKICDINLPLDNQIISKKFSNKNCRKVISSIVSGTKAFLLPRETGRTIPAYIKRHLRSSIMVNISENFFTSQKLRKRTYKKLQTNWLSECYVQNLY